MRKAFLFLFTAMTVFSSVPAEAAEMRLKAWEELTDRDISPQGKTALNFNPGIDWKHAETTHFVYHFTDTRKSGSRLIYSNAEKYYQWVKKLFAVNDTWSKKGHIFVFTSRESWKYFNQKVGSRTLPEAFTSGWELFIYSNPDERSAVKTLAHELTHIIVFRFLEGSLPLFLNEGFAEYVGYQALVNHMGQDEKLLKIVAPLNEGELYPLYRLAELQDYPETQARIETFYRQSESLARFLILTYGGHSFYKLLLQVSRGKSFRAAAEKIYGVELTQLEDRFRKYSTTGKINPKPTP